MIQSILWFLFKCWTSFDTYKNVVSIRPDCTTKKSLVKKPRPVVFKQCTEVKNIYNGIETGSMGGRNKWSLSHYYQPWDHTDLSSYIINLPLCRMYNKICSVRQSCNRRNSQIPLAFLLLTALIYINFSETVIANGARLLQSWFSDTG